MSALLFLSVLFFLITYNSGDSSVRSPLGWSLWQVWAASDPDAPDYTYCFLVPIMVGYLFFEKRLKIVNAPIRGNTAAIGWILLGLALFWIGSRAGKQYLGCGGIQILLLGIILWFWGKGVFRHLLFAWAIICFAWPIPFLDTAVAFPLRLIVSHLAYDVLSLVGIPCIQNGTAVLSAPNPASGLDLGARFQIDVADPCSGLHSLLPLLMFSAFYSYFFVRGIRQRWTVFLSAIPFTIIGNALRIVILVLSCIAWGPLFAVGTNEHPSFFHEACGFAVFIVVLGLECLLGMFLMRGNRLPTGSERAIEAEPDQSDLGIVPDWRSGVMVGLTGLVLLMQWLSPPVILPSQAGVVMSLPTRVKLPDLQGGSFFGSEAPVSEVEHRLLPKDTEFARKNYDDLHDHEVFFSIVLSGAQQYTIHPPEVCLVAQGWSIAGQEDIPIYLLSGHKLVVRNLTIQREIVDEANKQHLVKAYYMYWYVADGITTASHTTRNWRSSWDRVVHNRDHRWAYVIAMSAITQTIRQDGMSANETRNMLTEFIREIVPTFQKDELTLHASNP